MKVTQQATKTFYCHANKVKEIKAQLEAGGVPVWVGLGNRPEIVSSLNYCHKTNKEENAGKTRGDKKVQIRVKVVPCQADVLLRFCRYFQRQNDEANLQYHGESAPVVFNKALTWLFTSRRMKPSGELCAATIHRQQGKCAICGDFVGCKFEMDHISPLCTGGDNSADNFRALCSMCHAEETDKLLLAGMELNDKTKFHTIQSHMSFQLREHLHCAPNPRKSPSASWRRRP